MKKIAELVCMFALVIFALNMDSQTKRSDSLEPTFAPLQEGQGSFRADIHDGTKKVQVKDLSFFGETKVGGIRCERDDSVSEFDLSELNEIKIDEPLFHSKRFSDQVFTKFTIETRPVKKGKKSVRVEELLLPTNRIICGKEYSTGLKRAWLLSKIDKIVIRHKDYTGTASSSFSDSSSSDDEKVMRDKKKIEKKKIETEKKMDDALVSVEIQKDVPADNEQRIDESEEKTGVLEAFGALLYAFYDFIMSIVSSMTDLFY